MEPCRLQLLDAPQTLDAAFNVAEAARCCVQIVFSCELDFLYATYDPKMRNRTILKAHIAIPILRVDSFILGSFMFSSFRARLAFVKR